MFGPEPAKVCSVDGESIRLRIRIHLMQIEVAMVSVEQAIQAKREGLDWVCIRDGLVALRREATMVLPAIGDGPHVMSMEQWLKICERFSDVRTADELIAAQRAYEAHRAAHTPPTKGAAS